MLYATSCCMPASLQMTRLLLWAKVRCCVRRCRLCFTLFLLAPFQIQISPSVSCIPGKHGRQRTPSLCVRDTAVLGRLCAATRRRTFPSLTSCAYDLGARSPSRSCATLVGVYSHMLLLRAGGPVRTPPPAPTGSTRRVRAPCPGNHASVDDLALVALLVAKCGILSLILSFRFRLHTGSSSYVVRLWLGSE